MYRRIKKIDLRLDKALGYVYFMDTEHPLANRQGKVYYHRHVASLMVGRWLTRAEHVHHKNKRRDDNRRRNLKVTTEVEHRLMHARESPLSKYRLDGTPRKPPRRCGSCRKRTWNKTYCSVGCVAVGYRVAKRPTKDELASLIEETSFLALGRRFGVSDNAVRKWAKQYGLLGARSSVERAPVS